MKYMISLSVILLIAFFSICEANNTTTQIPIRIRRKIAQTGNVNYTHINQELTWMKARNVYAFTVRDIKGKSVPISKYKGKMMLIVNVASKSGLTILNYRMLVELHNKYVRRGLVILAFPCNQFLKQEPGTNADIAEFIKDKDVRFPMFAKIKVNGDGVPPLWKYLKAKTKIETVAFNFTKFIVDRKGHVVKVIPPASAMTMETYLKPYFKPLKSS